jgi:hypothetical protein
VELKMKAMEILRIGIFASLGFYTSHLGFGLSSDEFWVLTTLYLLAWIVGYLEGRNSR